MTCSMKLEYLCSCCLVLFTPQQIQCTPAYLCAVSTSIPEKPNALSPCMHTTGPRSDGGLCCSKRAAAIANPQPTPIVPNVPASNLCQIQVQRLTHLCTNSNPLLAHSAFKITYNCPHILYTIP